MNDEQRFARVARTWLEDGPVRAPDRAVDAALERITTTTQERDLRVPWRFPQMPMLLRVAAAAIVIAVVAGGALFLIRSPGAPGIGSQPTASPSPSSSAGAVLSVEEYVAARNAICDTAVADTDPLRPSFVSAFDSSLTETSRADGVTALTAFHARYLTMIDDLNGLRPPVILAGDHATNVQGYVDMAALMEQIATALEEHRDADAEAADLATEPIDTRSQNWENQHVLHHCP